MAHQLRFTTNIPLKKGNSINKIYFKEANCFKILCDNWHVGFLHTHSSRGEIMCRERTQHAMTSGSHPALPPYTWMSRATKPHPQPAFSSQKQGGAPSLPLCIWQCEETSILSLSSVLSGNMLHVIGWYQSRGLNTRSKSCPTCNQPMNLQSRNDISDKYRFN